jgi:hypothetical protein
MTLSREERIRAFAVDLAIARTPFKTTNKYMQSGCVFCTPQADCRGLQLFNGYLPPVHETCGHGMGKEIAADGGIIVNIKVQVFSDPGGQAQHEHHPVPLGPVPLDHIGPGRGACKTGIDQMVVAGELLVPAKPSLRHRHRAAVGNGAIAPQPVDAAPRSAVLNSDVVVSAAGPGGVTKMSAAMEGSGSIKNKANRTKRIKGLIFI